MRSFDFAPLYRSTVGFDRLANAMDRALTNDVSANGYPPYNIEKSGEDKYRISIAVAGFSDDELSIEMRDHQLFVSAKKAEAETVEEVTFLHRGIASRAFEKRFQLADHVRAVGASTENGILHIELLREVPEALKPRQIEIAQGKTITTKRTPKKVAKA